MLAWYYKKIKQEDKIVKKILAIAILIGLAGINTLPVNAINSENPDKKVKQSVFKKRQKKDSNQYKFDYINYEWWKDFNDEYLTGYIEKAILNNHDLRASSFMTQEYYQGMKMQFSQELPQVGGNFSPAYVKLPGTTQSDWAFAVPMYAYYEIDLFLKNHDKTKSARKSWEASLQDERAAHISIASAVGTTYINIIKFDKLIQLQEEIVSMRTELFDLEKLRYEEGISSSLDLSQSEKGLIYAQNDLIELKKVHHKLLTQFAVLIGESPENIDTIQRKDIDEISYLREIPSEISTEVITNRPDYKKSEIMVQKAGFDVKVARKDLLPSIIIGGMGIFNATDLAHLFTTKNMLSAIGGGIQPTLFTGGRKMANLKLKKASYERILENYYQTNLTAIQEVNDSLFVLKSDDERYEQLVKQYQLESESFNMNVDRFNEGILSKYDLLRYRESLLTIEKQLEQYKTDRIVSFIGLYKATGSQI